MDPQLGGTRGHHLLCVEAARQVVWYVRVDHITIRRHVCHPRARRPELGPLNQSQPSKPTAHFGPQRPWSLPTRSRRSRQGSQPVVCEFRELECPGGSAGTHFALQPITSKFLLRQIGPVDYRRDGSRGRAVTSAPSRWRLAGSRSGESAATPAPMRRLNDGWCSTKLFTGRDEHQRLIPTVQWANGHSAWPFTQPDLPRCPRGRQPTCPRPPTCGCPVRA